MSVKKSNVRSVVASVVIFGHLLVFLYALTLGVFSVISGTAAIQILLTTSPILAAISLAAFTYIIGENEQTVDNTRVSRMYACIVIVWPLILVLTLCALFTAFYFQISHFGLDALKTSLGGVETFFGVFLGAISKSLFTFDTEVSAPMRK